MKKKIFVYVFLFSLLFVQSAMACSCIQDAFSGVGSKANIERAAVIFKGSVQTVDPPPQTSTGRAPDQNQNFSKVTLTVQEIYKGQKAQNVAAYFDTATSCGSQVSEGESGLYILNEYMGVLVSADLCGKYIAPEHMKALKNGGYLKAAQETLKSVENKSTEDKQTGEKESAPDVLPEDIKPVPFTENFESENILRQWAQSSTFGGGYTEKRELFGKNLALVFRSYTSGIPSFDVGIYYQKSATSWALIKSHPPVMNDQPVIEIVDDNLLIITLEGSAEILSVGEPDLQ